MCCCCRFRCRARALTSGGDLDCRKFVGQQDRAGQPCGREMAVAMASSNSSSTPDWRAALRARNKEKKEQSPAGVSSAKREEPAAKSTPPWVRKNAISKSGTLESSPNTKRTLFGAPKQGTASAARATNGLNSLVGAAERQPGVHSSTLPRSFGRAEVAAAAAATGPASSSSSTSTAATTSRALDDSAAGRSTLASTLDPGRGTNAKSSEDRPSVSRLRDMFSKSDKAEKSSSPKQAPRPRSMVTSGQKPSRVGKSPSSASGSPATSQSVASSTPKKHLDSPTHGVPLKKISEERSSAVLSASVAEQLSSQSRNQPPVAPQTQATPSQSADSTNESLECTNIDDFVMEKGLSARSFSMNAVEMLKAIGRSMIVLNT